MSDPERESPDAERPRLETNQQPSQASSVPEKEESSTDADEGLSTHSRIIKNFSTVW